MKVVTTDAHEGPVYVGDEDALYFTSVPRGRETGSPEVDIKRLALDGLRFPLELERITVLRTLANAANGMTLGLDGRLVVCEQGTLCGLARISRIDRKTGAAQTDVDAFDGPSPQHAERRRRYARRRDLVHGSVVRVPAGLPPTARVAGRRLPPRSGLWPNSCVASDFDKPNGLACSPDERVLYVSASVLFDLADAQGEDAIDGLKVDEAGSLYVCGPAASGSSRPTAAVSAPSGTGMTSP